MLKLSIICCCLALILCCGKKNAVVLEMTKFNTEINGDTIWKHIPSKLFLVKVKDYGHLDEFRNQFVFIKKNPDKQSFAYKITDKDYDVRVSSDYLYFVNQNDHSFGWFYIKDGHLLPKLPEIDSILKIVEAKNKFFFIREDEGIISIFDNGIVLRKIHYGSYFINKEIQFNDLEYGLYRLQNKGLTKLSNNGSMLLKQKDGLYYVPYPGYNVNRAYSLNKISNKLDSLALLKKQPKRIFIDMLY